MATESAPASAAPARCPLYGAAGRLYFQHAVCGIHRYPDCGDLFADYSLPADHVANTYGDDDSRGAAPAIRGITSTATS